MAYQELNWNSVTMVNSYSGICFHAFWNIPEITRVFVRVNITNDNEVLLTILDYARINNQFELLDRGLTRTKREDATSHVQFIRYVNEQIGRLSVDHKTVAIIDINWQNETAFSICLTDDEDILHYSFTED